MRLNKQTNNGKKIGLQVYESEVYVLYLIGKLFYIFVKNASFYLHQSNNEINCKLYLLIQLTLADMIPQFLLLIENKFP